ncbi:MAG TPA: hypothetical protein DCZ13_00710 [Porticoccaceae bacterium]|nr:hypothetical protein [Porticoccaceae bacterium]
MLDSLFCAPCIVALPFFQFLLVALGLAGAAICSLFSARGSFKKARLIEDMPTSRIRSASQGYTELIGLARRSGEQVLSPLSATSCLWWRYKIEKYQRVGRSSGWVTIESGVSDQAFLIEDETGQCLVLPKGASLTTLHKRQWRGRHRRPNKLPGPHPGLAWLNVATVGMGSTYRYTEYTIQEDDPLYILGHFESAEDGKRLLSADRIAGDVLRAWKRDFTGLLEKHDSDGDGEFNAAEWRDVRKAARREALKKQRELSATPRRHRIRKGDDGSLPFIISSHEQASLSRKFRYRALAFGVGFLGFGCWATWYIGARGW